MKRKQKILILDDDESILKTLADGLKSQGYETDTALDGEDGLRKVSSFRPDYVVVDCLMPRLDGFQFCKKIKEKKSCSYVKIIMMSAVFTDQPFIKQTLSDYSPEAFLVKPFEIKDLIKLLKSDVKDDSFLVSSSENDSGRISLSDLKKRFKNQGELTRTNFMQLVYNVYVLKSTGVLTLTSERSKWVFYFYVGDIVKTVSNVEEEFFGSVAVKMGYLSGLERDQCLKVALDQGRRVGDVMIALKGLLPETIVEILKTQSEKRVEKVLKLEMGNYLFQQAVVNKTPKVFLQLNALEFILHRALIGEESFFRKRLSPYFSMIPQATDKSLIPIKEYCFTSMQRDIYSKIDGKNSIEIIVSMFPAQAPAVLKYLYVLIYIQAINFPVDKGEKESYRYLSSELERFKGANYFSVLGVSMNSSDSDVKKAYLSLVKEYHPDKNVHYTQPAVKKIAEEIFDIVTSAYHKLSTEQLRKEYDSFMKAGGGSTGQFTVEKVLKGENSFVDGVKYFNKNMIVKAKEKFEEALYSDKNNLDYSSHYSWALLLERQSNGSKKLKDIEEILAKNLQIDSMHETTFLVLGYLAKYQGNNLQAIEYFKKVLEINKYEMNAKREIRFLSKKSQKKNILGISVK